MANLIFLRQLKEIAQADEAGYTANDPQFKLAIASATQTIERLLGRSLTSATYTEILDVKRNNYSTGYDLYGSTHSGYVSVEKFSTISLKNYPVVGSISVYYDTAGVFDVSTLLDPSTYSLDADQGVLNIHCFIDACPRSLKVVYTAGYASTVDTVGGISYNPAAVPAQEQALANSLPSDLVMAAIFQAYHVFDKMKVSNINVKYSRGEGSTNSTAYVNIAGISPECMAICVQRRRPRIAVI